MTDDFGSEVSLIKNKANQTNQLKNQTNKTDTCNVIQTVTEEHSPYSALK